MVYYKTFSYFFVILEKFSKILDSFQYSKLLTSSLSTFEHHLILNIPGNTVACLAKRQFYLLMHRLECYYIIFSKH